MGRMTGAFTLAFPCATLLETSTKPVTTSQSKATVTSPSRHLRDLAKKPPTQKREDCIVYCLLQTGCDAIKNKRHL